MSKPRITVLGSYNTDLVTFTPRMPQPGETILGNGFKTGPGGKGSNQAVAAARLGAQVALIGSIGQDMFGEMALNTWGEAGIDTANVSRRADQPTGVAAITVDDAGENTIVVASGANWTVTPADVDQAEAAIAGSAIFLTQLELPLDAVRHGLALARKHGVLTILNPAPAQPLPADLLQLVDIITPNQTEAELITGLSSDNPEGACAALLQHGANRVIMTLGSQGALVYDADGAQRVPAFPVDRVVDTTGAGDAFNGALAVALGEQQPLADAVRFAAGAGAISVTRPGATESLPMRAEVDALLADA